MAGLVFALGPVGFWTSFWLSEVGNMLTSLSKEDLHMVRRILYETMPYVRRLAKRFIKAWEAHLPYGVTPLKSS